MPEAPSAAAPRYVFVYGTLRRGDRNDINRLQPAPRFVGNGTVRGTLHMISWYPGLRLHGEHDVVGEVYEITAELERVLDEIEQVTEGKDSEYFKRSVTVDVAGASLQCLVYEINAAHVADKAVIGSGDWLLRH